MDGLEGGEGVCKRKKGVFKGVDGSKESVLEKEKCNQVYRDSVIFFTTISTGGGKNPPPVKRQDPPHLV